MAVPTNHKPNEARRGSGATLHDVAADVGVHPSTVSRALNPAKAALVKQATRDAVEEAAERLGYRPDMVARGLQSGRTSTIGMVVADLGNTFVTPIIHQVAAVLATQAMMPIIAETQDDPTGTARILDHMMSRRVDAIVTAATRRSDRSLLEATARLVPVVIAARPLDDTDIPQAIHDDRLGGQLAARHLIDLGHRSLAQLRCAPDIGNFARREVGFSEACTSAGVEQVRIGAVGDRPIYEEGDRLMRELIDRGDPLPTGIFAHNDLMALGALSALKEHGLRVPEDISLVGYNDLPAMDLVDPALTTVRYPSAEIGRIAGELVVAMLAGEDVASVSIEPVLVIRKSTRTIV